MTIRIDKKLDASAEEIKAKYTQVTEEAFTKLKEDGLLVATGKPTGYMGSLPHDFETYSQPELATLMGALAEWRKFVNTALAEAKAKVRSHKKQEKALATTIKNTRGSEFVEGDRRYLTAASELIYWETRHDLLEAIFADTNHDYKTLSRLVTIRGQDFEASRRTNAVNGSGNSRRPPRAFKG